MIAKSSAEAELYASSLASSEAIGLRTYLHDLGWVKKVCVHSDSSSALSLMNRTGLGKAKHIDIQWLWRQEAIRNGGFVIAKVLGDANPSDLMTKHLGADRAQFLLRLLGYTCKRLHS